MNSTGQKEPCGPSQARETRSVRAHGRGLKATRGRVIQDIVTGEKRGLKSRYKELCKQQEGQRLLSLCLMPMLTVQMLSSQ